jgi:hypothetical protein
VMSADKLRKMWDSLSELRSSVCERRLEKTVLRPALLPVKTAQFTQFFRQICRHTVKSLSLTESVYGALVLFCWRGEGQHKYSYHFESAAVRQKLRTPVLANGFVTFMQG